MNIIDGTTQFHKLADLPTDEWDVSSGKARLLNEVTFSGLRKLRRRMLYEEFDEYIDGEVNDDIVEIVDGCLDMIVIAWGTLLAYVGEDKAIAAAEEVVRSNLSKVDGTLGPIIRREDGKLLKPEGWTPPDIRGAIEA